MQDFTHNALFLLHVILFLFYIFVTTQFSTSFWQQILQQMPNEAVPVFLMKADGEQN